MSKGRNIGEIKKRTKIYIFAEGSQTEKQYFGIFNRFPRSDNQPDVQFIRRSSGQSALSQILKSQMQFVKKNPITDKDQIWIVVDRDRFGKFEADQARMKQISDIVSWTKTNPESHKLALSNPKFECWLLYHFQDVFESTDVDKKLLGYLPNYKKGNIEVNKFNPTNINEAIARAKTRDNPPCPDWPREPGKTTVYRLVENILSP
ncbi:MAG: RloB family protein [Candidatus Symbiobacter sp.]|nr:RloB family protein [Candidatus Symbiobacter sp.]